jgi:hypothetical protein
MPAANKFDNRRTELNSPARRAVAVTPSDSSQLPFVTRWLYIGTAGDLAIVTDEGDTVILRNVPAGTWQYLMVRQVRATGTTAENIVAMA